MEKPAILNDRAAAMNAEEQAAEAVQPLSDDEKQYYKDARADLVKGELEAIGNFDKYILTLSSGGLALSVLFLEKIVPIPDPSTFVWILLSWLCFAFSLMFTLFSFLASHWAWRRHRSNLEFQYHERLKITKPKELLKLQKKDKGKSNPYNRLIHVVNMLSFACFFVGVSLFVMFAFTNLGTKYKGSLMRQKETRPLPPPKDGETKGAPAISPPPPPARPIAPSETSRPKPDSQKNQ